MKQQLRRRSYASFRAAIADIPAARKIFANHGAFAKWLHISIVAALLYVPCGLIPYLRRRLIPPTR
jgi:hypothetical protein